MRCLLHGVPDLHTSGNGQLGPIDREFLDAHHDFPGLQHKSQMSQMLVTGCLPDMHADFKLPLRLSRERSSLQARH